MFDYLNFNPDNTDYSYLKNNFEKAVIKMFFSDNANITMLEHRVRKNKDIYQLYFYIYDAMSFRSSYIKRIKPFLHNGYLYYDLLKLGIIDSSFNSLEIPETYISDPYNLIDIYSFFSIIFYIVKLEWKNVKSTTYVKSIFFLNKYYPHLISDNIDINNIYNVFIDFIIKNGDEGLLMLSRLLRKNLFNELYLYTEDESYSYFSDNDNIDSLKILNKNNYKSKIKSINQKLNAIFNENVGQIFNIFSGFDLAKEKVPNKDYKLYLKIKPDDVDKVESIFGKFLDKLLESGKTIYIEEEPNLKLEKIK